MIHIYTGDGKGKTTAATGLVVRALGAYLSAIVIRFIKKTQSCEDITLKKLGVPVEYYGTGYIHGEISEEAKKEAKKGIERTMEIINKRLSDILVLDEINVAVSIGVISEEKVLDILKLVPSNMEVILTGRGATDKMIDKADLITEMKEIKHYYHKGIKARRGIEF